MRRRTRHRAHRCVRLGSRIGNHTTFFESSATLHGRIDRRVVRRRGRSGTGRAFASCCGDAALLEAQAGPAWPSPLFPRCGRSGRSVVGSFKGDWRSAGEWCFFRRSSLSMLVDSRVAFRAQSRRRACANPRASSDAQPHPRVQRLCRVSNLSGLEAVASDLYRRDKNSAQPRRHG